MPRLATNVAGRCVSLRLTFMQEPLQHNSIDVFVSVDVGKRLYSMRTRFTRS